MNNLRHEPDIPVNKNEVENSNLQKNNEKKLVDKLKPEHNIIKNINNSHSNIEKKLDYFISNGKIPNIIFHGPAGSGKKTIIYNFLDRIYKEKRQKIKTNVMSVNCCHGKGIKFIREEVKFFSKMNIQNNDGVHFKSIVLYNADCLTIDAQSALRRCIELFSHNTRFFIVVENIHKLLNPIVSRFCEIYVPEILKIGNDNNYKFINLHKQQIDDTVDELDLEYERKKMELIKEKLNISTTPFENINNPYERSEFNVEDNAFDKESNNINNTVKKTPAEWIDIIDLFYEKGISMLDIITFLKNTQSMIYDINTLEFNFHKIKRNYRSEKLLMFQMLWNLQHWVKITDQKK
jgi:hypothetical protein